MAGDRGRSDKPKQLTVSQLAELFLEHARTHYRRPDGQATSELHSYRRVLELAKELYGDFTIVDFGPLALRAVRERMIDLLVEVTGVTRFMTMVLVADVPAEQEVVGSSPIGSISRK